MVIPGKSTPGKIIFLREEWQLRVETQADKTDNNLRLSGVIKGKINILFFIILHDPF
jgi:hypothetical protein